MEKQETTGQELRLRGVSSITEGSVLLLATVTLRDNSQDIWLECIDDNGDKVRLVPDLTGWQDGRKEVFVMNCRSGENQKLFFQKLPGGVIVPHDAMMTDEQAKQVMWAIPFPCLEWAVNRAR
jgi:hypothetical protein